MKYKRYISLLTVITISALIVGIVAGCGKTESPFKTDTPAQIPLKTISMNKPITVNASQLEPLADEKEPKGEIEITFKNSETASSFEDQFTNEGSLSAQGKFVVVYYAVKNNMKGNFQPATQINDKVLLRDGKDREWNCIDYQGPLQTGVSGNFAVLKNLKQPEEMVGAGFSSDTAVAFDVPKDAKGLVLVSEVLGFKLSLSAN